MKARYIDASEVEFLRHLMGEKFLPFEVALATGLRIGDVLKLRHADVVGKRLYYVSQKTAKAGVAQVSASLARCLKKENGSDFCFPGRDKRKPMTRQAAWARLKRACKEAGLDPDGISPHSTRKAFAVHTLKTCGMATVQRALQHNDLHTTEIYALSDWTTGANAEKPLKRKDISVIVDELLRIFK